jgi:hypothetical protein
MQRLAVFVGRRKWQTSGQFMVLFLCVPEPVAVPLKLFIGWKRTRNASLRRLPQPRHMIMVRQFFNRRLRPKRGRIP